MLPESWRIETFGQLLEDGVLSGIQDGNHGAIHPKASDYVPSGIPFVMARDLSNGTINYFGCSFIPSALAKRLRIGHSRPGDILISHKGTIGSVALVPNDFAEIMLTPQVTYYRVSEGSSLDRMFLFSYLRSHLFQSTFAALAQQSTRDYIGITEQKKLSLPLPPLPEQKKIADILSTWDAAIETTAKLLANAENQKRALMQQLLGGIKGTETHLYDLIDIKHGFAFSSEYFLSSEGDYILLTPGNFHVDKRLYFGPKTKFYTGPVPDGYELSNGDILVVMTDLTQDMAILGNVVILDAPQTVLHNQRIGRVTIKAEAQVDRRYLCYLMNSDNVQQHVKSTASGSTVRHTSPKRILEVQVRLPKIAEQIKVADLLEACDLAIQNFRRQVSKLNFEKRALMQQLLTGKRRVKI